jgi:hypothetical protein
VVRPEIDVRRGHAGAQNAGSGSARARLRDPDGHARVRKPDERLESPHGICPKCARVRRPRRGRRNLCRIHKTLRVTPAMEANLTDHVWTLAELLA